MGHNLASATEALERARDALLGQSQWAAGQSDWATTKQLIALAERADGLRQEIEALTTHGTAQPARQNLASPAGAGETPKLLAQNTPPSSDDYPKYRVSDGVLVKRGLQRDGKNFYEHAVPQEHFDTIINQIVARATRASGKQKPLTIEQVQQDVNCPRYMTYVVVSVLVHQGLLIRARKGSYTIASPATLAADANNLWHRLQGVQQA